MNKAEILKYLTEDPEGKLILEELKRPLLDKRTELLAQIKDLGDKLTASSQRELDSKNLLINEREAIKKLAVDDELERQFERLGIPATHRTSLKSHLKAHNQIEVTSNGSLREATIDGQKLSEFLDVWSKTDEGKSLLPAPVNDGGGSPGSRETGEVNSFEKRLQEALNRK